MTAIFASLRLGWFSSGRIGLNVMVEVSHDGKPAQEGVVYLDIEQSSVMKTIQMTLMQENPSEESKVENELSLMEGLVVIILFLAITHLILRLCLRSGERNFYEKTEKEEELLDKDNSRRSGPDYIEL